MPCHTSFKVCRFRLCCFSYIFHTPNFICPFERCPVFKAMLYGNMQEGSSHRVILNDITSTVLNIVLGFIHTETIDNSVSLSTAVGIYRAASFLLLPKLMKMVLDHAHA